MSFKLAAIDLDGTLLDDNLYISPRTRDTIRKSREAGCQVTLCTGRMFVSALPYARQLGLDLPLITYHGALVKASASGEEFYRRAVPLNLAREVLALAGELGLHLNVYLEDHIYVEKLTPEGEFYASLASIKPLVVGDLLNFLHDDPIKMVAVALKDQEPLATMESRWRERRGNALYVTRSQKEFLEFMHPEATKGRGLAELTRRLGLSREEVLAIGDSWNDLEMFKEAGMAVAMGNAPPEVKSAASYVTKKVEDDGVAEALEKLVLGTKS